MPDGVKTEAISKQNWPAKHLIDGFLKVYGSIHDGSPCCGFTSWVWHRAMAVDDILVVSLMVAILFTLSAKCMFAVQTSRNLTKQRLERQRLADQAAPAAHVAHEEQVFQAPLPANDVLLPNEVPLQNDVSLQTDMPFQQDNTPTTMLANMKMLAAATSQLQFQIDFAANMDLKQKLLEIAEMKNFEDACLSAYAKHLNFVDEKTVDHETHEFCDWRYFEGVHPGATFAQFEDHQRVSRAKQHKFDKERNECMQKHFDASIASYDAYIRGVADRNAKNRARNADLESMSDAVLARMLAQRGV